MKKLISILRSARQFFRKSSRYSRLTLLETDGIVIPAMASEMKISDTPGRNSD